MFAGQNMFDRQNNLFLLDSQNMYKRARPQNSGQINNPLYLLQAFFRSFAKKDFIRAKIATMRKQKMPVMLLFPCFWHVGTAGAYML